MYSVKKLLAVILTLAMVLTISVSAFAASFEDFTDLKGHWARSYMEDLYERGMLSGYPDGTMKPGNEITGAEALTLLSKIYKTTELEDEIIHEDFGKTVDSVTPTAWVKPSLEKALAAGLISAAELKAMPLFESLSKEELSRLIIRAVRLEDEAADLADAELTYADVEEIDTECLSSIALLTELEITQGDNNNKFGPKGAVTRAIAATMVSRLLAYVDESGTDLAVEGYSGLSLTEGILSAIDGNSLAISDKYGVLYVYETAPGFGASINGSSKTTSIPDSLYGSFAELRLIGGRVALVKITAEKNSSVSFARFEQLVNKSTFIRAYDYNTGKTSSFDAMKASVTVNGEESSLSSLKEDDYLKLTYADNDLIAIDAVRGSIEVKGEVSSISFDQSADIMVGTSKGDVLMQLNFSGLPEITRAKRTSDLAKLRVGDGVTVTYTGGEITAIDIEGMEAAITGTIVAKTQTIDGTELEVRDEKGAVHVYNLAKNAIAYSGSKTIELAKLGVADEVALVIFDDEIVEITLIKAHSDAAVSSVKLTVDVLYVDSKAKRMDVKTEDGSFLHIQCSSATSIILVTVPDGKIKLSDIKFGEKLTVYGSYSADGEFEAYSIIIENKL